MSTTARLKAQVPTTRVLSTAAVADIAERWAGGVTELWRLGDDPLRRSGTLLVATDDYDVWLLRWPQGTRVNPHDHGGSAGAFVVISGELVELRWEDSLPVSRIVRRGETVTIEPAVVHDVVAMSGLSYSVHAYSPPLREMSFYDEVGTEVTGRTAVQAASSKNRPLLAWCE